MKNLDNQSIINQLIETIEELIPEFINDPIDKNIANGNVAICIIDELGNIYGKLFGDNKLRSRETYNIAWKKASQVAITGIKTGEFEKLVFNGEINEAEFGIRRPDFVGYIGGQPIEIKGIKLSVGFSGFRGETDLKIVKKAIEKIG